jgi:hypothetical protein
LNIQLGLRAVRYGRADLGRASLWLHRFLPFLSLPSGVKRWNDSSRSRIVIWCGVPRYACGTAKCSPNRPDIVWAVAKAGNCPDAVWIVFGIRIANTVRFAECCIMSLQVIK